MIEILRIVEDALAGIARDDLIVAPDFLENLGADSNLANLADFITRCGNGDSAANCTDARKVERGCCLLSRPARGVHRAEHRMASDPPGPAGE